MRTRFWTPFAFLLPALALYLAFVLLPIAGSFFMSFQDWTRGATPVFIGISNYAKTLCDAVFWRAFMNNALILVGSLLIQLPLAALLAVLLNYRTCCRSLFRTSFFAPMVMPTIAIAFLWMNIYSPVDGIATRLCRIVCGDDFTCRWLSAGSTSVFLPAPALLWIFVTICWQYTGFHMVLYMAGIAAIPDDIFEAARLDGASEVQIVRHVILPSIRPTIAVSATLSIIGSLKYFDLIYLMGGALSEMDREVVATYIYRLAFEQGQGRFGQGSAAAVILLLSALAIVVPLQWKRQKNQGLVEK